MTAPMKDKRSYCGSRSQLAGIEQAVCVGGRSEGVRLIDMHNSAGLDLTLTPDRCLDLYRLVYKGVNVAFHSKNPLQVPPTDSLLEEVFFEQWPAGMLTTCGLSNFGSASETGSEGSRERHPLHGRIGLLAADITRIEDSWESDSLVVEGAVRETRLYGRELELRRKVEVPVSAARIRVVDRVMNYRSQKEGVMLLYHLNFGYPFLDETTLFYTNMTDQKVLEQETYATGLSRYSRPKKGADANVLLVNAGLELAVQITWGCAQLPHFYRWRHMVSGDWVVGIEPATAGTLDGRERAETTADLVYILPSESVELGFSLRIEEGHERIAALLSELGLDAGSGQKLFGEGDQTASAEAMRLVSP